jgi:hypothetical protein
MILVADPVAGRDLPRSPLRHVRTRENGAMVDPGQEHVALSPVGPRDRFGW